MSDNSSVENKLSTLKYDTSEVTHIVVDNEKCKNCKTKDCLFVCPACVYSVDEENKEIAVEYENCLECGACRMICPHDAIKWQYPNSSKGVIYKYS